jgi:hypothetical protein
MTFSDAEINVTERCTFLPLHFIKRKLVRIIVVYEAFLFRIGASMESKWSNNRIIYFRQETNKLICFLSKQLKHIFIRDISWIAEIRSGQRNNHKDDEFMKFDRADKIYKMRYILLQQAQYGDQWVCRASISGWCCILRWSRYQRTEPWQVIQVYTWKPASA